MSRLPCQRLWGFKPRAQDDERASTVKPFSFLFAAPDDDPNYDDYYYEILFMGPRNGNPGNPGNKIARGNSGSSFTGALYFPSEHLDWAGNPSSTVSWGMVVANRLNISGTADTQVINPPIESQAPKTYRMLFAE